MKIRQMRQIIEVCRCKSINKAAQNLYISQSSLCASINSAEEELGQKLLARSYSGIEPTEFGQKFIEASQKILKIYDELLTDPSQTVTGQLSVSCQYLKFVGSIFTRRFTIPSDSRNHFRYAEKTRDRVCQDVIDGISELGIIVTPTEAHKNVTKVLTENDLIPRTVCSLPCCCLVGPEYPLYHKESNSITLQQLAPFPRLFYERSKWLWGDKDIFSGDLNLFPHQSTLSISDSGSFQNILTETPSYFIGIYADSPYQTFNFYPNIRRLQFSDISYPYDVIWIQRKSWKLTPIAKNFLRTVYEALNQPPDAILL